MNDDCYYKKFLNKKVFIKTNTNRQYTLKISYLNEDINLLEGIDIFSKTIAIKFDDIAVIEVI